MRHHRPPASPVDIPAVLEAALAMRALARTAAKADVDVSAFIVDELGGPYGDALPVYISELVAHIERAQRVADRFRKWRYSKGAARRPLGQPEPIGTPLRAIRHIKDEVDVSGVVSTVLAVRALDREDGKRRERRFVADLCAAFSGWPAQFVQALIIHAERDRRFARRFRTWRRAKAARTARPPSRNAPGPARQK